MSHRPLDDDVAGRLLHLDVSRLLARYGTPMEHSAQWVRLGDRQRLTWCWFRPDPPGENTGHSGYTIGFKIDYIFPDGKRPGEDSFTWHIYLWNEGNQVSLRMLREPDDADIRAACIMARLDVLSSCRRRPDHHLLLLVPRALL